MNFEHILEASPAIQIHLATAVLALVFGIVMWFRPKGTPSHKFVGRSFILLMLMTATSAIFIREINNGTFSFIHIFVPITFIGSWQVVSSIRRKDIKRHQKHVRNIFWGALLIPGLFAFLPGRHMWMMFFG